MKIVVCSLEHAFQYGDRFDLMHVIKFEHIKIMFDSALCLDYVTFT